MFALTRRIGERLYIGNDVILEILDTDGQCARIGIDAPREILVLREELITQDGKPPHKSHAPQG